MEKTHIWVKVGKMYFKCINGRTRTKKTYFEKYISFTYDFLHIFNVIFKSIIAWSLHTYLDNASV
jgi:hypothetical protein